MPNKVRIKSTATRRYWKNLQEIISPDPRIGETGEIVEELDSDVPSVVVRFYDGEDMYKIEDLEGLGNE